jgi:hypothetical protein
MNKKLTNIQALTNSGLFNLRFKPEAEIKHILENDFALSQYYDIFDNSKQLFDITNNLLSKALLLNREIAPRIYNICDKVKKTLAYEKPIDFYLCSNSEENAFSVNGFNHVPHMICFTSSLIQKATDEELHWIIGHEMGHLIFEHNKLDLVQRFLSGNKVRRDSVNLKNHYFRYLNFCEISADRIGFLVMPDITVVTKSLFKLTYGLSEEHLNFDVLTYLKQLDRIREIKMGNLFSSHPNTMIRIKALCDFAEVAKNIDTTIDAENLSKLDENILENLQMLEIHPQNLKYKKFVQFLAAAGYYMASYDENTMTSKWNILCDMLSNYTSQPEYYLQFESTKDLLNKLKEAAAYYAKNPCDDMFTLLENVVGITLSDGRLEEEEKKRLFEISKMMNVSHDAMNLIIQKISQAYLSPNRKQILKKLR